MIKQELIKELKEEIVYAKKMIAKGDHVEERKQELKDMAYELDAVVSGKEGTHRYLGKSKVNIEDLFKTENE